MATSNVKNPSDLLNQSKNKQKTPEQEIRDLIDSNQYNFTTSNLDALADVIKQINTSVKSHVKTQMHNMNQSQVNPNAKIVAALKSTLDLDKKLELIEQQKKDRNKHSSSIRTIADEIGSGNYNETAIFEASKEIISNIFSQFNEFASVCAIIPELGKVVNMFSRDILNVNDVTKNIFNELFKKQDFEDVENFQMEDLTDMNDEAIRLIISRNDLERKIRRYIKDSLIKGCQPVSVIPYKEIIRLMMDAADRSNESVEQCVDRLYSAESMYLPKLSVLSTDNVMRNARFNRESWGETVEKGILPDTTPYDKIINNSNAVEAFLRETIDEYDTLLSSAYIYGTEDARKENIKEAKKKLYEDQTFAELKEKSKPLFMNIINQVDQQVEVVNPSKNKNLLHLARKTIEKTLKFKQMMTKDNEIKVTDFTIGDGDKLDRDEANKSVYKQNANYDKYSNNKELNELANIDDVLITEYDPQMVIPFIVNGKHIGYWIIEEDAYNGGALNAGKRSYMTFTDIIKSLGFNDDAALSAMGVPGVLSGIVGSPDIPSVSAGTFGAGIAGLSLSSIGSTSGEANAKIDMMKDLLVRTVATRVDHPDLADDKTFRDAMMNLIRDGFIVDKKIKVTFIPENYMVYFAYELDSYGLPKPLFANTLLFCYLYISSVVQSLMIKMYKSSNKDMVEFNMGLNKSLGTSIRMIEQALSTRSTHSWEMFKNIQNVLKNASVHERIIVPIIDGEKLFNYTPMEKINDLSIDDEYTQKLLDSILSVTPIPTSMLNKLEEDEYSRSIISQHINYMNGVIDCQSNYNQDINKLLKLIAKGTKFKNDKITKNIDKIDFKLTVPEKLSITNMSTSLSDIQGYLDSIVPYVFGPKAEDEMYAADVAEFKYQLVKMFVQEIDWKSLEEIKETVLAEHNDRVIDRRIDAKITTKNEEAGTDDSLGSFGGGGGDMGGGDDMGGDEEGGGDDDGMGGLDDFSF